MDTYADNRPSDVVSDEPLEGNYFVSAYPPLSTWAREGTEAVRRLEEAGYTIRSAFAAVRNPAKHRFVYQDAQYRGADVVGLGVAAFSYYCGTHYQDATTFDSYLSEIAAGRLPVHRA